MAIILADLAEDIEFLVQGYTTATKRYTKLLGSKTAGAEKLKEGAWECVEYQELLQEAQAFQNQLQECQDARSITAVILTTRNTFASYLRNLFKKRRTAASHVLVIMIAEERRAAKPYAVPVQYIPYSSIRDQQMRDLLAEVKRVMTGLGMSVVG